MRAVPKAVHASALNSRRSVCLKPDTKLNTECASRCFTFPRRCRLTESRDYRRVFAKSSSVTNQHLLLLGRCSEGDVPRLGLAIAKKHLKRAVDRNRVKRAVRESFRRHQHTLTGIDIIVLVRRGIQSVNTYTLQRNLDEMWLKLNRKCTR